ncbi:hypothetical protein USDA257_p05590 (plasmid) [Sinorhizobium fredii USDA 257]|uniref:Uncharacterized protein n=2 Tax=Sinorhizobium TaxID=28105 RepID=I3XHB8_SINF2|nr:hypothetical protein USDA257_p05590 [Sinorhizobium fredii USDA 257]
MHNTRAVDVAELNPGVFKAVLNRTARQLVGMFDSIKPLLFDSSYHSAVSDENRCTVVHKCIRQIERVFVNLA